MAEKVCQWVDCGKNYQGRIDSRYCKKPHYKKCDNPECNNRFQIKEMKRPAKTCSKSCSDVLTVLNRSEIKKNCEICGDEFGAFKTTDKFCSKKHMKNCEICGNSFEFIVYNRNSTKTCSKECAWKLVENVDKVVAKRKFTNMKKYGVENPSQAIEVKDKKRGTALTHYGVENVSQAEEVKEKREQTFFKRFGESNPMKNKEVQNRLKAQMKEKYGVENVFMNKEIQDKAKASVFEKYGVENIFLLPENQLKAAEKSGRRISKVNKDWQKILKEETGVEFDFEQGIGSLGYADLGYENLLIDINPTITHNSTTSFAHTTGRCIDKDCQKKSHNPRDKNYHHKRALEAEMNDKILLQYFDWYDPEIFVSIVKSKLAMNDNVVYARKTELREIKQPEANRFLRENHLMGASTGQNLCLGLFHDNELIHVQTYGRARMNKNYEWEAIRSCTKLDYHVPGGFTKCDKYFFNKVDPVSVISYVDLSISQGRTDSLFNGWELKTINKPSATWVRIIKDSIERPLPMFVKDSTARRVSADRLLGFEVGEKYPRYDEDGLKITNDFVFLSEGFVKIYDAGTKTFTWEKQI